MKKTVIFFIFIILLSGCTDLSSSQLDFREAESIITAALSMNYSDTSTVEADIFGFATEGTRILGTFDKSGELVKLETWSYGSIGKNEKVYHFVDDSIYITETLYRYEVPISLEYDVIISETTHFEYVFTTEAMFTLDRVQKILLQMDNERYEFTVEFLGACREELSSVGVIFD